MKNKGITLISLVITIIILIILAGISVNLILGGNGLFEKAKSAKEKQEVATYLDRIEIARRRSRNCKRRRSNIR